MKPRNVTRTVFASPIFWALIIAHLAGRMTPLDASDWIGPASGLACACLAHAIERWYITARAKAITTQGIIDAAAMRPDVFRARTSTCDACQTVVGSTVTGNVTQVRGHRGNLQL